MRGENIMSSSFSPKTKGRRLIDRASVRHMANEKRILSGLTAAEQRQLADLLRKLRLTLPPLADDEPPAAGRRAHPRGRS
jgi:hypothetical protein